MTQEENTAPDSPRWWQRGIGRLAVAAGLVVVLGLVVWLSFLWDRAAPLHPIANTLEPAAVAVADRVFLLGKLSPSAAYAVETPDGLVLIDTGLEANAAGVIAQLESLGLDVDRLRAILLTHAHGDHTLGATHLRARTGATVHAGRGDCRPLREGGPREAFFSTHHMPNVVTHKTTVDVELVGDEVLTFGDARFTVLATPGHTPGSVCYLLERGGKRTLFAGDVVQSLSQASTGALGTYVAYLPPLYRGNARDYLASLRKLRALPVPDLVLPGHPRMDPTPQSPRLGEERWHKLLDGGITEMERLVARHDSDGANFLDGVGKELRPALFYLGDQADACLYAVSTPKGLILFDAPGGDALGRSLPERLRKAGLAGRKVAAVFLTSADTEATAGLAALVKSQGCKVVVARDGLAAVRERCPAGTEVLAAEDLREDGKGMAPWLPELRTIPLGGRGMAPLAYRFRWAGKIVLVSGRIPAKPDGSSRDQALRAVAGPGGNVEEYRQSLARLSQVRPDLWLPAVAVHGQNANLYDRDWEKILLHNRQFFGR